VSATSITGPNPDLSAETALGREVALRPIHEAVHQRRHRFSKSAASAFPPSNWSMTGARSAERQ
jgi:hypothetical protein